MQKKMLFQIPIISELPQSTKKKEVKVSIREIITLFMVVTGMLAIIATLGAVGLGFLTDVELGKDIIAVGAAVTFIGVIFSGPRPC